MKRNGFSVLQLSVVVATFTVVMWASRWPSVISCRLVAMMLALELALGPCLDRRSTVYTPKESRSPRR